MLKGQRDSLKRYLLLTCYSRWLTAGHWLFVLLLKLFLQSILSSFVLFCIANFYYLFQDALDLLLLDLSLLMNFLQLGELFLSFFALSLGNFTLLGLLFLNFLPLDHFAG